MGKARVPGGRTVGHGPYRFCGPPARSLTQRLPGPLPPPVGPESLGPHHTPRPTTQESDRRCHCAQDPGRWMGKAHVRGRTVGHGPYRFCGPPARSLTQRPLGPMPASVGPESLGPHHTPRPTTQESDRCCHCTQDPGRWMGKAHVRWRTVGYGPYRTCGPPARSLTQRPLGPLPPPVGPESLGPDHTPRPTTQESDRCCHCAQNPGR